jgi:hypothetical protein
VHLFTADLHIMNGRGGLQSWDRGREGHPRMRSLSLFDSMRKPLRVHRTPSLVDLLDGTPFSYSVEFSLTNATNSSACAYARQVTVSAAP